MLIVFWYKGDVSYEKINIHLWETYVIKCLFITKPADTLSINKHSPILNHIYGFNDSKGFRVQNEFMIL